MPREYKYWAFISYSHVDQKWGEWLHRKLETFRVPKALVGSKGHYGPVPKRIFPVFRDREELPTSADLGGNIRQALEQSRCLIVICSPRAARSSWVNEEIITFKRFHGEDRVLALMVDGEPNATDGKPGCSPMDECFPSALRFRVATEGLSDVRTEPIAADARKGKDGPAHAFLKLCAGALGVGYDGLRQREKIRRRQQALTLAAASLLLAAGVATIWKWQQWRGGRELLAQNRRHLAAQEEELGRQRFLRGDYHTAAGHLARALTTEPQRASVQLMLGVARHQMSGLHNTFGGFAEEVESVAFDPTGEFLLGIPQKGAARVWNVSSGQIAVEFGRPGDRLRYNVVMSPDGKWILYVPETGHPVLHNLRSGKRQPVQMDNSEEIKPVLFSPESNLIVGRSPVYGEKDLKTRISVCSVETGELLKSWTLPRSVSLVGITADSRTAILIRDTAEPGGVLNSREILSLHLESGKQTELFRCDSQDSVELNAQGDRLLVQVSRGPSRVYAAESGQLMFAFPEGKASGGRVRWAASGKHFYSLERDGVYVWERDGRLRRAFPELAAASAATFDASGQKMAIAFNNGEISTWNVETGERLNRFEDRIAWKSLDGFGIDDEKLRWSPDGRFIACGGKSLEIKLWQPDKTRDRRTVFSGHSNLINSLVLNRAKDRLLTASADGSAAIWNVAAGNRLVQVRPRYPGSEWPVNVEASAFTQDESRFITGVAGLAPQVWDAKTGSQSGQLEGKFRRAIFIKSTADRLITIDADKQLLLWHSQTLERIAAIDLGGTTNIVAAQFVNGGSRVLVAGDEGELRIFDAKTGKSLSTWRAEPGISEVEQNATEDAFVVVHYSGTLAIYDASGQRRQTLNEGGAVINQVAFSPDGKRIVAASSAGEVMAWNAVTSERLPPLTDDKPLDEEMELGAGFNLDLPYGTRIARGFVSVAVSSDNKFIAAGTETGRLLLWDAASGKQLMRTKAGWSSISKLQYFSSDTRLLLYDFQGAPSVWELPRVTR